MPQLSGFLSWNQLLRAKEKEWEGSDVLSILIFIIMGGAIAMQDAQKGRNRRKGEGDDMEWGTTKSARRDPWEHGSQKRA